MELEGQESLEMFLSLHASIYLPFGKYRNYKNANKLFVLANAMQQGAYSRFDIGTKYQIVKKGLQNNFAKVFCTEKFEDSWNYIADLLKLDMEPRLNTNRSDKDYKKNINRKNLSEQFIAWHKNYNSYDYALYEEFCT